MIHLKMISSTFGVIAEGDIRLEELLAQARIAIDMADVCHIKKSKEDRRYYYWLILTAENDISKENHIEWGESDKNFIYYAQKKFNTELDCKVKEGAILQRIEYIIQYDGTIGANMVFKGIDGTFSAYLTPFSIVGSRFVNRIFYF